MSEFRSITTIGVYEKVSKGTGYIPKVLYRKVISVAGQTVRYKVIDPRGFIELPKVLECTDMVFQRWYDRKLS